MKVVLNIILFILILLAIVDLFIWLAANGSGHKIPDKTNKDFLITFLVLSFLIGIVFWIKRISNNRKTST